MGALIRPALADRPPAVRGPLPHAEAARYHALRRLRERFGKKFTADDMAAHLALVQSGACDRVSAQPPRVLFKLIDRGEVLYPLYHQQLRQIITYLPEAVDIAVSRTSPGRRLWRR